jgi:hypothetical protein
LYTFFFGRISYINNILMGGWGFNQGVNTYKKINFKI